MITPINAQEAADEIRRSILTSPAFIAAVALLILNDWVLKPRFGSWWTGKLSDVAGLFAFAVFWSTLLPRHRRSVFALTAIGFLFWKSPLTDAPLAAWNALAIWPLARVVDYTDWIALVALVPAYGWLARRSAPAERRPTRLAHRIGAVAVASIAVAAFAATSVAPPSYPVPEAVPHVVQGSRSEILAGLDSLGVLPGGSANTRRSRDAAADTLRLYIRQPPERLVGLTIEVRERAAEETMLTLLEVSVPGPAPRPESIHRAFREQVVEPLRERLARSRLP